MNNDLRKGLRAVGAECRGVLSVGVGVVIEEDSHASCGCMVYWRACMLLLGTELFIVRLS